jgi:hypothetical protein
MTNATPSAAKWSPDQAIWDCAVTGSGRWCCSIQVKGSGPDRPGFPGCMSVPGVRWVALSADLRQGDDIGGRLRAGQRRPAGQLMDAQSLFLTGNADTVYFIGFFDLTAGPMALEISPLGPPKGILGTIVGSTASRGELRGAVNCAVRAARVR